MPLLRSLPIGRMTLHINSRRFSRFLLDRQRRIRYDTLQHKVNRRRPVMQRILFVVALGLGLAIAYVDSRPNWDDTGITAAAILVSCGLLGVLGPKQPLLWALAVGLWIPLCGIAL